MSRKRLQYCIEEGKFIEPVQICLRCGRKFELKRGRKSCPVCQGLFRIKTMILKAS